MAIAIIGGGLSGTLTAIQLLLTAQNEITIYLIEQDRYKMNRGVAYASQLPFQPLNVPAAVMSLFPDKPDDFYTWLTANQQYYKNYLQNTVSPTDFIPRFIFGDYLKDRLLQAEAQAPASIKFIKVYDEVVAVKKEEQVFSLYFKDTAAPLPANKVVLALGNFAPAQLPIPTSSFYSSNLYFASPWSAKVLDNMPADADLLLIGSSLTMVDLVGSLQAKNHQGNVYVVSRHGLLPQPFDVQAMPYPKLTVPHYALSSALTLFRFIRNEIKTATQLGYNWRSVLDALRDEIPVIWSAMPLPEKMKFMRHIRPYWETHRHRMPASSSDLLSKLQQLGRLEVIAATVLDMQQTETKACVTIKRRKHKAPETILVDRVINCTGPVSDFEKYSYHSCSN